MHVEIKETCPDPDFKSEGHEVEVKLLRALAMGGKRSVEIQLLLDSQAGAKADFQQLALVLADLSVPETLAKATFERLSAHQSRLRTTLGRPVGIKTAVMDYLENIERFYNLKEEEYVLSYAQLAEMAFQDQLTGMANFRYFQMRFSQEIKRADRYGHLLSLAMVDIDYFKRFNDEHGHLAGNKALEHVAAILRTEIRDTDIAARYGGEEFALLFPETTKNEALVLTERIRAQVAKSAVLLPDASPEIVTISLGLATYPRDAHSADAVLAAADEALYLSKNRGRNQVNVFTPASSAAFSYSPSDPGAAHSIAVVGDFNGWNKTADLMAEESSGKFSLTLRLAPGRYSYKFVINNEWYIPDPLCNRFVHDGYGGKNSILNVNE